MKHSNSNKLKTLDMPDIASHKGSTIAANTSALLGDQSLKSKAAQQVVQEKFHTLKTTNSSIISAQRLSKSPINRNGVKSSFETSTLQN